MSKTLSYKTVLASGVVLFFAILIFVSGCTTQQKKRGIVFRGDWAFEINRTPWVGHPGNTDIPGMEEDASKQRKSLCSKEKDSSLSDALLGPLASLKSKCRCKNCVASSGNINITSYNPTIANSFPNSMTGTYPGALPQNSLSLPPGAIAVPAGVLMPNGTMLPHHFFYTPAAGYGNLTNQGQQQFGQQGQSIQNNQSTPNSLSAQNNQTAQQGQGQVDLPPPPSTGQPPHLQAPTSNATGNSVSINTTNTVTDAANANMMNGTLAQGQPLETAPTIPSEMQNILVQGSMQHAMSPNLNPANQMLVNPALAQVMPGMSMTGTQSPGYPPIAYAPSGYSPGYAQQLVPPITGPLGAAQQLPQQALASAGTAQASASADSDAEEGAVPPQHVVSMPYPRHHPVPIRPVYQRSMGMAPNYQAVRPPVMPPYAGPGMTPGMMSGMVLGMPQNMMMQNQYPGPNMYGGNSPQMQISQAAALQERQLMLERQRQALIMQQNASVQRTSKNQASHARKTVEADEYNDDNTAPVPPTSKILLANHQTSILCPPAERVSQMTVPMETPKSR